LVVDDDDGVLHALSRALATTGNIWKAQSCMDACRFTDRAWDIDAAIVDYRLGDGTGDEVIGALRKSGSPCGVIVISGVVGEDAARAAMRCGADVFLRKPVDFPVLIAAHESLWRTARSRRAWLRKRGEHSQHMLDAITRTGSFLDWVCRLLAAEDGLTEVEARVLRVRVDGISVREVAVKLRCSESTAKAHLRAIFRKLKITASVELWAVLERKISELYA
jgi:DNA-binding NarL/FixJ family response regulator